MTVPRPALMLIHGSNGSGPEMAPLADLLRPHIEVFTPNLPGHGGRELTGPFDIHAFAQDLLGQLDERAITHYPLLRGRLQRGGLRGPVSGAARSRAVHGGVHAGHQVRV